MDKDMKRSLRHGLHSPRRQRGAVVVLVAAGMLAIIAMAGLALDLGDSYLSKTRLQNALDAAALSGAKTLNEPGGTTANAQADAIATFNQDPEMVSAGLTPVIQFSATLIPFAPGATEVSTPPARYVRARVDSYPRDVWFAAVLGITDRAVAGTAVSGPIPLDADPPGPICGVVPMSVCLSEEDLADKDCSDGECYGYRPGAEVPICLDASNGPNSKCPADAQRPGNLQLLRLECPGADCVRESLAGGGCVTIDEKTPTQTGEDFGAVAQGLNTRFNEYRGGGPDINPETYPPDEVVKYNQVPPNDYFWYSGYENYTGPRLENGVPGRRVLAVPMGRCPPDPGQAYVEVKTVGCFYVLEPAEVGKKIVLGQFVSECKASGPAVTDTPPDCPGAGCPLFKIVLYKDPDTKDS